jgi:hypothetical protein
MDGSRVFDDSTGFERTAIGGRLEALPGRDRVVAISTISFGFEPHSFVDGQGDIAAFSSRPDRADLPGLVDVIARGQEDGHVLAIYPEWQDLPVAGEGSVGSVIRAQGTQSCGPPAAPRAVTVTRELNCGEASPPGGR